MSPSPLAATTIVECNGPGCPPALRRATALAGRIAADLGARVVRIVDASDAEFWRAGAAAGGSEHLFLQAGKQLLPAGHASVATELGRADGIIAEDSAIAALAPAATLVLVAMSGDGTEGVNSEFTAAAAAGLLDIVGDPACEPLRFGGHQLAYAAGLAAYLGLVTALCAPPGVRRPVRVNLVDVGIWLNWKSVINSQVQGSSPSRMGRDGEWHVLECADGWVAFVYRDWDALRAAVTDPRLDDPRYATRTERRRLSREIGGIVEESFRKLTRREIGVLARRHRIPLGPIWTPRELLSDSQYLERNFFHSVSNGNGGTVPIPRTPVLWNGEAPVPGNASGLSSEARP